MHHHTSITHYLAYVLEPRVFHCPFIISHASKYINIIIIYSIRHNSVIVRITSPKYVTKAMSKSLDNV